MTLLFLVIYLAVIVSFYKIFLFNKINMLYKNARYFLSIDRHYISFVISYLFFKFSPPETGESSQTYTKKKYCSWFRNRGRCQTIVKMNIVKS